MRLLKAPLVFLISKVEIRMFHFRDGEKTEMGLAECLHCIFHCIMAAINVKCYCC